ncbi:hypothetical protein FOZ60_000067 [Perkinsus olseni]|uniref:Cation efflux protein transmembrane domain-containing protein n=3 Tax=Perkinsus olseni TaxID=32597 RepID=A0A7J6PPN9_PEROL|nr:hypothetical protein FOZ60_000067 [Perkinsus olseni]
MDLQDNRHSCYSPEMHAGSFNGCLAEPMLRSFRSDSGAAAPSPRLHPRSNITQVVNPYGGTVTYAPSESGETSIVPAPHVQKRPESMNIRVALHSSLVVNIALTLAKAVCLLESGSLAVLASLVDSLLDLLSQLVLWWTEHKANHSYNETYPAGQRRLEPLGVVICACWMGMASIEVIRESAGVLAEYIGTDKVPPLEMTPLVAAIMIVAIASKTALYFYCRKVGEEANSENVKALAQDHINDVFSNTGAVLAAWAAYESPKLWWVDSTSAILISLYIIGSWIETGKEQAAMIAGRSADPEFLANIREIANQYHPELYADIIRAYHFGPNFLVELEMVLPETYQLRESHDIGMGLQHKIEDLDRVERAFVHIDYQERPYDEHDENSWPNEYYEKVRGSPRQKSAKCRPSVEGEKKLESSGAGSGLFDTLAR